MPVHDWTRVDAGLFHDFHQGWTIALRDALNSGELPPEYFAIVDQKIGGPIRSIKRSEASTYAARANRITIRHRHGELVAAIEFVSPGNKANQVEFHAFVQRSVNFIREGVHLLIVDLFPRDHVTLTASAT